MIDPKRSCFRFLLAVILLFCARDGGAFPVNISGIVFQDKNHNGRHDKKERVLSDAVLSDGVQVTRTDERGRYSLSTESSRVLFLSLPGGFRIEGQFFEHLGNHRDGDQIDFPVVKQRQCDFFSFLFFADSHVTSAERYNAVAGMKAAVAHMNSQDAVLAISGGDLIMDALRVCESRSREQYRLYQELVSELRLPLFNTLGNHELYGIYLEGGGGDSCVVEEDDPLYGVGLYREYLGPDHYSFNWGPYHFVVLNTIGLTKVMNSQGDTVRTYHGTVSPEQLRWLEDDLAMVSPEAPIILVGHIPFLTAAHTLEGYNDYQVINYDLDDPEAESYTHVVNNASRVVNEILADRHFILAIAGHHHHYEVTRWADSQHDATFVVGGSICGQWWQGDRHIAGSTWPEGYVMVTLKDGRVKELRYIPYDWKGYKE
jgi:Icc protein